MNRRPIAIALLCLTGPGCDQPATSWPREIGVERVQGAGISFAQALDLHYPADRVVRYDVEVDPAVWQAVLADPMCTGGSTPCGDSYVRASFRFEGETYRDVGIRLKGNSSRGHVATLAPGDAGYQRYSLKLKFDEFVDGQTLHGIAKLNLQNVYGDPSYLRERIAYDLLRAQGVPASRVGHAVVFVNGERLGLYLSVQQVDAAFLRQWFGDDGGNLYKSYYGDLVYRGAAIADYGVTEPTTHLPVAGDEVYAAKTNEDSTDHADLIRLADVLGRTPIESLATAIGPLLDVDLLARWLAVNSALAILDSYAGGLAHNYYLYRDPGSGRFVYIPWDLNNAFGSFGCFFLAASQTSHLDVDTPYCRFSPNASRLMAPTEPADRPLISRLLQLPDFKTAYHQHLEALRTGPLAAEALSATIAHWRALIEPEVNAETNGFYRPDQFVQNLSATVDRYPGLLEFARTRNAFIAASWQSPVVCGDGVCSDGENCPPDCPQSCATWSDAIGWQYSCGSDCHCPHAAGISYLCCDRPECAGQCVPDCRALGNCPAGAVCETSSGLCVPAPAGNG
jgi:spore coat protein H